MKIVIACDSFKGSMSSAEVADAAERGIVGAIGRGHDIVKVPVADGGEGTTDALVSALHGSYVTARVHDPLMRPIDSRYGMAGDLAIIDMASASGLPLLDKAERDPAITTTFGTGELIADAWTRGCRRFLIGIGGSATNDGGKGMLEALGVRFFDADGRELAPGGLSLARLARIDLTQARNDIFGADITVICDVTNPLCGHRGASAVYGPQKGADARMVALLDAALARYAEVSRQTTERDVADMPGAGAAGGLGAAFLAFTDARLTPGIDAVLDIIGFGKTIEGADMAITGEGRIDRQTLYGKVPAGVLARCRKAGVPVVAIAGAVIDRPELIDTGFAGIFPIVPGPMSLDDAMKADIAAENVEFACSQIVKLFDTTKK